MRTVLLTIQGPSRSVDAEVAGEAPVSELLPLVIELCGETPPLDALRLSGPLAPPPDWALELREGVFLPPMRTLVELNVVDGMTLTLRDLRVWREEQARRAQFAPREITPSAQTGGVSVTWRRDSLV